MRPRVWLGAMAGVLCLAVSSPLFAQGTPLKVVVTFSVLSDLVKNVGGDRVSVTTLVGPDGDAHTYQPTPSDARAVGAAAVMVTNGLGLEGWLDRLMSAAQFKGKLVVATSGIKQLTMEEAGGAKPGQPQRV